MVFSNYRITNRSMRALDVVLPILGILTIA